MTRVWSRRPPVLHLALFFVAYVLGCGFAQALAIVPGITVSIWPPAGIFVATLIVASPYSWPWWILAGCLAEMFAQLVWFHSPLPAGFLIYVGNALAAVVGASLVTRACGRPVRLETLREVLALVMLSAGIAPVVSATVGSTTLAWFGVSSQSFAAVWPLFWIGDATGILLVAPLALVVLQNWRSKTQLSAAKWMEAGVLGLIFLGVAALSLSNYYLPFAYIIMPPLLWAAVRFEFKGVAVALTLLALITMALTISGDSQFVGDPESQRQKQVMLQLFLAISALAALIVAAISRQHQLALLTLRKRERELSQIVNMVPSHLWQLTPEGEPTFFNKRMVDFLKLDIADAGRPGMSRLEAVIEAVHPDDAEAFRSVLDQSLATGEHFSMRYRLRRADGVYRWMSSRAEPMWDQDRRIVQWYGLCHDIDDQMQAEEALREREQSLRRLVETLPVMIDCATPDGEPIYRSQQLRDFLDYDLEELDRKGKPRLAGTLDAAVHPDDLAAVKERLAHSLTTGESYACKHRLRRFDGKYRWVESRAAPMRDGEGAIVQWNVICLDIDGEVRVQEELRLARERLARASQAASLAELSASIAHEVNQPLAAIVANSHACHRWLSAVPPNVDRAEITAGRIIRDANSAADVVSRIRALFKQYAEPRDSTALGSVVAEAVDLITEEAARRRVRIDAAIEGDLPLMELDRVQIQQVLINLMRNGIEAMDSSTQARALDLRVRRLGDVIQVEINDGGAGVAFPDRIFEPFFTTKNNGMGMGLAICRSIVEAHGGRLWTERNEPHGAKFLFTLPVEPEAVA